MADLTTLTDVKDWMGIPLDADSDDALLSRLITSASALIQTWLNRSFASQDYNEARDGAGGARLVFADYPVTAVSSVVVDGLPISASSDFISPGYRFDEKTIMLNGFVFGRGMNNVQLSYTAGYATTPPEVAQACIEMISLRYKERDRIGHQSKSLAGETVTFFIKDMPDSVRTVLNNYRKVVPL